MVLPNTSYEDIFLQMENEKDKVRYYLNKGVGEMYKKFIAKPKKGLNIASSYCTIPVSHNRYAFLYHTTLEELVLNKNINCIPFLVVEDFRERDFFFCNFSPNKASIQQFTSHFLKRYRERVIKDDTISTENVLLTYLIRNVNKANVTLLQEDKIIAKREKHRGAKAILMEDGVVFFQFQHTALPSGKKLHTLRYKTFLSHDMLKDSQNSHIQDILFEIEKEENARFLILPDEKK